MNDPRSSTVNRCSRREGLGDCSDLTPRQIATPRQRRGAAPAPRLVRRRISPGPRSPGSGSRGADSRRRGAVTCLDVRSPRSPSGTDIRACRSRGTRRWPRARYLPASMPNKPACPRIRCLVRVAGCRPLAIWQSRPWISCVVRWHRSVVGHRPLTPTLSPEGRGGRTGCCHKFPSPPGFGGRGQGEAGATSPQSRSGHHTASSIRWIPRDDWPASSRSAIGPTGTPTL